MAECYVQRHGHGYGVFEPGGKLIAGPFSNKPNAEEKADRVNRDRRRKPRKCLTCGERFLSDGPHNRMCSICRTRRSEAVYEVGHRRARIGVGI